MFVPPSLKSPFDDPGAGHRAGKLGMTLFLISLGMLFAATIIGLVVIRLQLSRKGLWPEDLPRLPWGLVVSTAVIALSSIAMHRASTWAAAATDDERGAASAFRRAMIVTTGLGTAFLVTQIICWLSWLTVVRDRWAGSEEWRLALTAFYVLTGLHGLHVLGGLVALVTTVVRDGRGDYTAIGRRDRAHYCAMYWHFLGIVWLMLYALLLLWG